ncbi:MAG: hypothetical protein ACJ785_06070 [Gemmatimonadaceae bacterium]
MRRFSVALLMILVCAGTLGAQRRGRAYSPNAGVWVSGGIAGFTATGVNDGRSGSSWNFGNSYNWQYRASLEKSIDNGSSFGVSGSWSRVPFVYSAFALPATGSACGVQPCDAHLDMMALLGTFHFGAGQGFHQVIELNGGIVSYTNLKRDVDGAELPPSGNIDPLFSFGYGVGYGFSNRTQIDFVPDYAIALHERTGLSNGVSNTNSMRSLRVTLRMGFGGPTGRR